MDKPVAIITGAGRGIGRATALEMACQGYRLVLAARSEKDLQATAAACGGLVAPADVADRLQVQRVIDKAMEAFGRVDAIVNNAGFAPLKSIEELTPEEWRVTIDTNLSAAFFFCRGLWPIWRRQGGGTAVNVSSFSARDPFNGFSAYGAAKAGLNTLGLALAKEGAAIGVRVHTVAPAAVETEMFRALMTPEQYPADKTLSPDNVARVIAQCVCGDLKCTSGEVIYVHKTP